MEEKKLLSDYRLVYVDGFKIRNFLDDDFAVIHTHSTSAADFSPKFYIPPGEVWLDGRYRDEKDFLCLAAHYYDHPSQRFALDGERRMWLRKHLCAAGSIPDFRTKEEKENGVTVVYVDGRMVREYIDPEFVLGGHGFAYDYIPKGEIWLDVKMDPAEVPYILLHERVERDLVKGGKSYDVAHEHATAADKEKRRLEAGASYPGDNAYPWYGRCNAEVVKNFIVSA